MNYSFALDLAPANLDRIQEWIDQGRIDPTKPITVRELAQSKCIHSPKEGVKLLARGIDLPAKSTFKSSSTQQSSETTATTESQPQSEAQTAAAEEEALVEEKTVLKQPIHLVVSRASASAIAAVEAAGGSVTTRFYTKASIARIMKRETHPFLSTQWAQESGNAALHAAEGLDFSSAAGSAVAGALETKVMSEKGLKYRLPDPTKRRDIEYYRDPAHRGYLSHLLKPLEGPSLFFRSPVERKSAAGAAKKEKVLPENRLW